MVVLAQTDSLSLMVGISSSFISVSSMPCAVWLGFEKPKKKKHLFVNFVFVKMELIASSLGNQFS